ncbi:hypothetical protein H2LOC_003910 [Methylocystis heyeri]|uniref:Sulfur globule protein n=2 Tax=Methylocystis heyeri TaxID=391905 RepID=A0A6B8KJR3_9HYPH|nr:hypothetical protein [Methylocystis heyeri]QGM47942.1 hypothetical protein H2LOC_003910 [Methylocystis heyeri]
MLRKTTLAAGLALGALTLGAPGASAMPALDPGVAQAADSAANVDKARWVCGPYRCWWRPNYYRPYGVYRPYGGYGYYHGPRRYWHRRYW